MNPKLFGESMATGIVPKRYQKTVSICYYIAVAFAGLILLIANLLGLLTISGITTFPDDFTQQKLLALLGISTAFMATLLWFGMVLDVFRPDQTFRKLVTAGFVAGLLAAVASAITNVF
ncbi:hypothetical protein [Lysobacter sp. CCNWLW3]|uniref:hypothetical protein n=2 Tax=Lysobacter TaxID=68 RepID=UPI002FD2E491